MKICVYAICKNESKFVERWLDSMQEADYIVVLDTGSTDDTYRKLKADPRVTKVEKKAIKPWRFDVARNESMKLIPEDTDLCVCTDLDEVFDEGWADVVREAWKPGTYRMKYRYAWSHNAVGEPTDVFDYDKMHKYGGYHWKYPVHEVLQPDDPDIASENVPSSMRTPPVKLPQLFDSCESVPGPVLTSVPAPENCTRSFAVLPAATEIVTPDAPMSNTLVKLTSLPITAVSPVAGAPLSQLASSVQMPGVVSPPVHVVVFAYDGAASVAVAMAARAAFLMHVV